MIIEYVPRKRDVPFTERNINLSFKKSFKNFLWNVGNYICTYITTFQQGN